MLTMEQRIKKAGRRYLELRGYKVIDQQNDFDIVCDEDETVFVKYIEGWDNVPKSLKAIFEDALTNDAERIEHPFGDVRCDTIEFKILGGDRALIRHAIDVLNPF